MNRLKIIKLAQILLEGDKAHCKSPQALNSDTQFTLPNIFCSSSTKNNCSVKTKKNILVHRHTHMWWCRRHITPRQQWWRDIYDYTHWSGKNVDKRNMNEWSMHFVVVMCMTNITCKMQFSAILFFFRLCLFFLKFFFIFFWLCKLFRCMLTPRFPINEPSACIQFRPLFKTEHFSSWPKPKYTWVQEGF